MPVDICMVCSEENCTEQRCQDRKKAIQEFELEVHSIEQLIEELYP